MKDRQPFALSPDDQPVAGIGYVTLSAARPAPFEVVHAVSSTQVLERLGCVLENKVDQGFQGRKVNVFRLQAFGVSLKLRGEFRPQQSLHPHGVEHLFRRGIARALLRDNLLRLADGLQRLVVGLGVLEAQGNPLLALDLLVEGAGDGGDVVDRFGSLSAVEMLL